MKKALNYLLADEMAGTAGALRSRMIAERLALKTQDGTLGQKTTEPQDAELEDMQIRVGDETHYHQPAPRTNSSMLPWILAAALGAGGLGAAGGMYMTRPDTEQLQQAVESGSALPEYSLKISTPHASETE